MDKKDYVFKFLNKMFSIFGLTIVVLSLFCLFIGEKVQHVSTLFDMGYAGLSIETIFQLLLVSFIITTINTLVFSDLLKLYISKTKRIVILVSFVFATIFIFIHLFKWFPTDLLITWLLFALCFVISSSISIFITFTTEKTDDKNMEIALKQLKEQLKDNEKSA